MKERLAAGSTGVRIVLVEDDMAVREFFRTVFRDKLRIAVVGEAGSASEAVLTVLKEDPDIVLLDLNLAGESGFDVVDKIRQCNKATKILIVTGYCDDYTVFRVSQAPVDGFIYKSSPKIIDLLAEALERLLHGEKYFCEIYAVASLAQRRDQNFFGKILSDRECLIVSLIARSFTDNEIAKSLEISVRTAETHRSNILRKLGLESTPKLIGFALDHGFVHLAPKVAGQSTIQKNT
jgi:DNA-binding NarL/FixJ family response regulator